MRRAVLTTGVFVAFALMLAPVAIVVVTSFHAQEIVSFPPEGYTLGWYRNAWLKREFADGLASSLKVALLACAIGVPLGTAAALGLARSQARGRELVNMLLLSPLAIPGVVLGTALYLFFLRAENWIDRDLVGTTAVLVTAHVLLTLPWTVRLVGASLRHLDRSTEEAAANLGAGPLTVFWRITLPAMRPGVFAATMFAFVASFENLELTLLLVGPGVTTLPVAMMSYLEFRVDPTVAAVATAQIVLVTAMLLVTDRFVRLSTVV